MPCLFAWTFIILLGRALLNYANIEGPITSLVFNPLTLEFIGGALAGWIFKVRRLQPKAGPTSVIAHVVLAIGLLLFIGELTSGNLFPTFGAQRVTAFAIPAVMIVYGLAARDSARISVWKPLVTLGDWSYALYLTHVLSLTLMGRIWARFNSDNFIDNIAVLIVMIAATIIISGFVYKYIEAPIIKAARNSRRRLFN